MKTNNIDLVKQTWSLVAQIEMETVGGLFYNRLFELMPEVKPMFSKTPLPEQSKKLLTMLSYVISKLDKLDEIMDEVAKLAQRHTKYGVKDEHYAAVGTALLWTLEKGLGDQWNDSVRLAWTEVYTTLANAMMEVQQEEAGRLRA
ncbi:hemoglobin [Paraflavitalea soli]|uniref:Hemoglobin n=1 Tax=Paraflavitalea soli TaxID=2315862 RepID=A0A3B7MMW9_9BACT|nr:globin family protein [Paraflavitalea soli]AXY74653.1 hemoglobin [Paraflavitalea soli]